MGNIKIDVMWDDRPIDVSKEVDFIQNIENKLRGPYQSDKYKDDIIPMTIIRRFECALEKTKEDVIKQYKENPNYPVTRQFYEYEAPEDVEVLKERFKEL